MPSARKLQLVTSENDIEGALPARIDVVAAAMALVEAWKDIKDEDIFHTNVAKAERQLGIVVRRYKAALRGRALL
jgi:hypothetical protein